jgi:pimeloyl-ACP methyl ester carboxylesterase
VLHGAEDPILPVEHGRATAVAVPGARLVVEEGVGHDLPAAVVGRYVQEILDLVRGRV